MLEAHFRARLRRELPGWQAEGLLGPEAVAELRRRHRLDESGAGLVLGTVYAIGALLVGGGVISLVAWHWAALHGLVKLGLVLSLLAAVQAGGVALRARGRTILGEALLLLGGVVLGASIGLVAQLFHVGSTWWGGIAAWGAGALAAGVVLRSPALQVLAAALLAVSLSGVASEHGALAPLLPWAYALAFAALSFAGRSRALFFFAGLGLASGLPGAVAVAGGEGPAVLLAGLASAALLLALPCAARPGTFLERAAPVSTFLGFASLVPALFALSFHDVAGELGGDLDGGALPWLAGVLLPALLAAGLAASRKLGDLARRPATRAALVSLPLLALCVLCDAGGVPIAIVANVALLAAAAAAIHSALAGLERGPFWGGVALVGVLVLTRFLELETELWAKALAFLGAGVATLALGLSFERRLKGAAHAR